MVFVRKLLRQCLKDKMICISLLLFVLSNLSFADAKTSNQALFLYKHTMSEVMHKQAFMIHYKLIDLIRNIPKPLLIPLSELQYFFNNQLHASAKDNNSLVYVAGPFQTLDGVLIKKIVAMAYLKDKKNIKKIRLIFDQQQCVNSILLKKRFGFLIPDLLVSHPIPNAPIAYHTTDKWGKLSLYETMDYPNCIDAIGINVFFDKQEKQEWIQYVHKQAPYLR